MTGAFTTALDRLEQYERTLIEEYVTEYGTRVAFAAYAFVFGYYGFLKVQALVTGLATPVRGEVGQFVTTLGLAEIGISLTMVMAFIGVSEMALGLLFLFRELRLAIPVFLAHQTGTFLSLGIARTFYF
jgi:hypothetical protein